MGVKCHFSLPYRPLECNPQASPPLHGHHDGLIIKSNDLRIQLLHRPSGEEPTEANEGRQNKSICGHHPVDETLITLLQCITEFLSSVGFISHQEALFSAVSLKVLGPLTLSLVNI